MVVFNASFMMERDRESQFVDWISSEIDNLAISNENHLRISAMREAGGIDYRNAEAQTVALQCEFTSKETAQKWTANHFASLAARYEEKFGPQALVFTSIFEIII